MMPTSNFQRELGDMINQLPAEQKNIITDAFQDKEINSPDDLKKIVRENLPKEEFRTAFFNSPLRNQLKW